MSSKATRRADDQPSFDVVVKQTIATIGVGRGMVILPADAYISSGEAHEHSEAEYVGASELAVLAITRHAAEQDPPGDGDYEAEYEFTPPPIVAGRTSPTFTVCFGIKDNG